MKNNYKSGSLSEGSENGGRSTSYTINKNEIFMCLRNSDGTLSDFNTTAYVLWHEVSHQACDEISHTPKFWKIF